MLTVPVKPGILKAMSPITMPMAMKLAAIPEGKTDNKYFILMMILRHLSSDDMQDAEDDGVSTFLVILDFIKKSKEVETKDDKSKIDLKLASGETAGGGNELTHSLQWKKEFKILGSIGLPGQKEKLFQVWHIRLKMPRKGVTKKMKFVKQ